MLRCHALLCLCILFMTAASSTAQQNPAEIAARRLEMGKNRPFAGVVPRSNEPQGELTVLRIWPDSVEMRIAVAALQGLANRERPQLYIGIDKPLRYLEYYSGKTITNIEADIWKVFEKFGGCVKGIVVYDNSLDTLANVAITYAGIEDLIPADPELAKELSNRFGWKVVHDLRNRWKTRLEAYTWAYENLFPRCEKFALMHYNSGFRDPQPDPLGMSFEVYKTGHGVDYAVQFKMFNWHVPTEPTDGEKALAERIMESVPFHTPIFGRSSTQDCFPEPAFVSWVARFANLHIPAGMGNISVLSGARVPAELLRQKELPVRDSGPDKVYVAFTISEKDNLEHVIGGGPPWHRLGMETDDPYKIWWNDPWRGRVPVGWPLGPLVADLAPTTLAHFMTTATENDYFLAALSGLCLSDPENYGTAYPQMRDKLLDEYADLTGAYMRQLGWTQMQPVGAPGILRCFVRRIPELTGIMEGYGPHKGMTIEKANYTLNGVPVFHALTEGTFGTSRERPLAQVNAYKAKALADEINNIKTNGRPAFIHAWVNGWDFGPTVLKMATDQLPPDYVVVRPDELAALYKKYGGDDCELKSCEPQVAPKGRVTEALNGDEGLIIDTGAAKFEIGWGSKPQPPFKRVMGVDGKWRGAGNLYAYNPRKLSVTKFTCRRTMDTSSEKRYVLDYEFNSNGRITLLVRAIAGKPYLLIEEKCEGLECPSWSFGPYADFQPQALYTDAGTRNLNYNDVQAMGGPPWYRWVFAGKTEGPERDLIGFVTSSFVDWTGESTTFWQHTTNAYWEFYHSHSGTKKFALAALDRNIPDAPAATWRELNGMN